MQYGKQSILSYLHRHDFAKLRLRRLEVGFEARYFQFLQQFWKS